jgi:hypothetical protein
MSLTCSLMWVFVNDTVVSWLPSQGSGLQLISKRREESKKEKFIL